MDEMDEYEFWSDLRRDGVGFQVGQVAKLESQHVRCFENNLWCDASFKSLLPT